MTAGGAVTDQRQRLSGDVVGVGGGLLVLGASSYVFLTLSARQLSPGDFAVLSVVYTIVYALGPGVFLPIEQELGRALADRRERGVGGGPVLRQAAKVSLVAVVGLAAVVGALSGPMSRRLFDGRPSLQVVLLVGLLALWAAHATRGAIAGLGRFGNYGLQLGVEGATRAVACVVLAAAAVHGPFGYALLVPGCILVSVVVSLPLLPQALAPGPPADPRETTHALAWLLAGSLLSQVIVNGSPIAAKALARAHDPVAGRLLAGLVLTRIPLFLFGAVQAALLPNLSALAARGDRTALRLALRRLLGLLVAITIVTTVITIAAGPELLRLVFGPGYGLGRDVLAELAIGTGSYLVAATAAQSLVALQRYAVATACWLAAAAVFLAMLAAPISLTPRISLGFLAGCLVAAASALTGLLRATR